jgi:hypothetical protein
MFEGVIMKLLWFFLFNLMYLNGLTVNAEPAKDVDLPMTIVIVRNLSDTCAPNCPQWISAEGKITKATPAQFRKTLNAAGKLRLPVIIQSSGGDIDAAMQIGRMIRKQKLDVAVGWTLFKGNCKPSSKNCKLPPTQNGIYGGLGFTGRSFCNSACGLVLASGVNRMSGSIASVGVHQPHTDWKKGDTIYYRDKYRIVGRKKIFISRTVVKRVKGKSYSTTGLYKGLRKNLTKYLNEMGVSVALFDYMEKAPYSSIYWMTMPELKKKIKLINSSSDAQQLSSFSICKTVPVPAHCVLDNSK